MTACAADPHPHPKPSSHPSPSPHSHQGAEHGPVTASGANRGANRDDEDATSRDVEALSASSRRRVGSDAGAPRAGRAALQSSSAFGSLRPASSPFASLRLDAFLAEVGVRIEPPWVKSSTVSNVRGKLAMCGIETTEQLAEVLRASGERSGLNPRLRAHGQSGFRKGSLEIMNQLLLIN